MRKIKTIYLFAVLLVLAHLFLNNSGNPPNGKSGAPGDGTCADCHSGGSFSGSMFLTGLPTVVNPNTTYSVTLTNNYVGTAPDLSGFQLTARTNSNQEAGSLSSPGAGSTTTVFGGKTYLEHNPAQFFGGSNQVSWTFDWTAPNGTDGENYTFFYSGVFADGTGGTGGDAVSGGAYAVELDVPLPLSASTSVNQNVSCFGGSDGVAMVNPTGGTPPYSYSWSNGDSGPTLFNVSEGTYTVIVSDALSQQFTGSVVIMEPAPIDITILNQSDITCFSNGSAMVSASGGTSGYNYQWSNGGTSQMQNFNNGGSYVLTVSDALGCTASIPVNISENTTSPIADIANTETLTCDVNSIILDGSNSASNSGQTDYQWSDSAGAIIGTNATANANFAGTYTLIVTDVQNGCTSSSSVAVFEDTSPPSVTITGSTTLDCNVSVSILEAISTANNALFEWSDNSGNTIANTNIVTINQAGNYTVVVTDIANGCTASSSVTVVEDSNAPLVTIAGSTVLNCNVSATTLEAVSNTSNVNYQWSDNSGNTIANTNIVTINQAGNYTVVVTDITNGCTSSNSITVVEDTNLPTANAGFDQVLTCSVNSVTLDGNASSTGTDVEYLWTSANGSAIGTNNIVDVSTPGTYTLTVTNTTTGCTSSDSVVVTVDSNLPISNINAPSVLNCNNTTVTLDGTGSSTGANIIYEWIFNGNTIGTTFTIDVDTEGTYTFIVTDVDNGCQTTTSVTVESDTSVPTISIATPSNLDCSNPQVLINSNVSSTNSFSCEWSDENGNTLMSSDCNLMVSQAGTFTLVATDDINGCTASETVTVQANSGTVEAVATALATLNCNTTCVILDPMGSSEGANITYQWTGPNGFTSTTISPCVMIAGTYTLDVTDTSTGCTNQVSVEVIEDTETPNVTINQPDDLTCSNSSVIINSTGSSTGMNYTYEWITLDGNIVSTPNIPNPEVSTVGTYTLTIFNTENGCFATSSVLVNEADSDILLTSNATTVDCNGAAIGSASVTASGGVAPYTYNWSNGETTETINGLVAGIYIVDVMDTNGCTSTLDVIVAEADPLMVMIDIINETVFGANDGSATATVSGGTPPYFYEWNNGISTTITTIDGLSAGTYELTVTDANNCTTVEQTVINSDNSGCDLSISIESTDNICFGGVSGTATVDIMSSNSNATIEWSNGATNTSIFNLSAGTYIVTVSEGVSCLEVQEVVITEPLEPQLVITEQTNIDCANEFGSVSIDYESNTVEYDMLSAGNNTVTVTNSNACISTIDVNILEIDNAPIANAGPDMSLEINCIGSSTVTLDASGTSGFVTVNWSGVGNIDLTNPLMPIVDAPGTYDLVVTNDLGCTSTDEVVVDLLNNTTAPIVEIANSEVVICFGSTEAVVFDGTGSSEGDNYTYEWINGLGDIISTELTATVTEAGFYSLIVTDNESGCTSVDIAELSIDNLSAVYEIPTFNCVTSENVITIIAQSDYPPISYLWDDGSTESTITVTGNTIPSATVTDAVGCSFVLDENVVILTAPPITVTEVVTDATEGNADGAIEIEVGGGTAPYQFLWNNNATTANIDDLEAGVYSVTITDSNGCESVHSYEVDINTSTRNLIENESITLSPNPNTGQFWIEWENPNLDASRLEIVDFTGKRVYQNNMFMPNGQAQLIQLEQTPTGIYMVNFYTNKGLVASKKVMVVR